MKLTMRAGVLAVGILSASHCGAEEASQHLLTALSSTTISGFVDTSQVYNLGSPMQVVPEPSTVLLTGAGLFGIIALRHRLYTGAVEPKS